MYEEFYRLAARPFSKTPDPKFLFLSRNHEEALARLQYAVEEKETIMAMSPFQCKNCAQPVERSAKYCPNCGTRQ